MESAPEPSLCWLGGWRGESLRIQGIFGRTATVRMPLLSIFPGPEIPAWSASREYVSDCSRRSRAFEIVVLCRKDKPVPDPGMFPMADALSSLGSVMVFLLAASLLLIFWQMAILLGIFIADLLHEREGESGDEVHVS